MKHDRVAPSSRSMSPQGWTVVYRDDCGDLASAHIDYDPPEGAGEDRIVDAVTSRLSDRCGAVEVPEVLFIFRGRHADLVGDARRQE